jgi:hypothetical protein
MNKSDLRASKDSQGFYEVKEHGRIIWEGFAKSAKEAKELAIANYEDSHSFDWE